VGMPAEMPRQARTEHSGFRLIEGFVDQLDGRLMIDRTCGTAVAARLPRTNRMGD
jgi:hypothetical protein